MKLVSSILGGISLGVAVTIFIFAGCGGDKSAPPSNSGGSAGVGGGGNTNVGGSANNGGNTSANTAGGNKATGGSSGGPQVVPRALLTDFSEIVDGTTQSVTNTASIGWGDSAKGLTGGTFLYQQADTDALTATVTAQALSLTGSIAVGHYAGFGFYFGPNQGSDASKFTGFSFTISGTLANATVDVQMQMTDDYPLNSNNKGKCDYITADAGQWVYCKNPHVALSTLLTAGVTATTATVQVPFTSMVGGNPVPGVDPKQLLGIQFQFNCGSTACSNLSIKLDDLTFYPAT